MLVSLALISLCPPRYADVVDKVKQSPLIEKFTTNFLHGAKTNFLHGAKWLMYSTASLMRHDFEQQRTQSKQANVKLRNRKLFIHIDSIMSLNKNISRIFRLPLSHSQHEKYNMQRYLVKLTMLTAGSFRSMTETCTAVH